MNRTPVVRRHATPLLAAALLPASWLVGAPAAPPSYPAPVAVADTTEGSVVRSADGVVVTGHPLASRVGARVLAEGGNAVDAAVAAAFTLAVVEPSMSGLGGRTQVLLRMTDGEVAAIDGTTEVPAAYEGGPVADDDAFGPSTIAVPGTVAALAEAAAAHGTWPLARLLAPAESLARVGFPLAAAEAERIADDADDLRTFPGSRRHFLRADGSPYGAGEVFRQPALARTLGVLAAEGPDAFYRGSLAQVMARELAEAGALVAASDLAAYRAERSPVVRGSYRGLELVGSYLPASGATTIEILQILDHFDLTGEVGSVRWAELLTQALLAGFEDRERVVTPPAEKARWLTSRERAGERAREIRDAPAPPTGPDRPEPDHTTHLSVADRDGNVVAMTQSVGPSMGSKVASPELGFLYAATMEYLGALEPGTRRHWSSQSPLFVLDEGRPVLVLGAAGGRRIISSIVATVSRFVDDGGAITRALEGPRLHPTASTLYLEARDGARWTPDQIDSIASLGYRVELRDAAPYFGRVNVVAWDAAAGEWVGAVDPR